MSIQDPSLKIPWQYLKSNKSASSPTITNKFNTDTTENSNVNNKRDQSPKECVKSNRKHKSNHKKHQTKKKSLDQKLKICQKDEPSKGLQEAPLVLNIENNSQLERKNKHSARNSHSKHSKNRSNQPKSPETNKESRKSPSPSRTSPSNPPEIAPKAEIIPKTPITPRKRTIKSSTPKPNKRELPLLLLQPDMSNYNVELVHSKENADNPNKSLLLGPTNLDLNKRPSTPRKTDKKLLIPKTPTPQIKPRTIEELLKPRTQDPSDQQNPEAKDKKEISFQVQLITEPDDSKIEKKSSELYDIRSLLKLLSR
ncbi:hypothetical protein TVAG_012780 [Trichomonas vaginalis G3]|uniref:Uncharacterized protein n=1 Tax=Trichomonas vaginalis (strain ATCC PRA-98 / G3) TaxID=412133 RepID=A2G7E2_TRIV3|nr:hypothetical protein TVAGG3_0436730 [Trichomonas vaginalis G3]EAX86928.1 hypothetical protein TVAG_012780 [Trichomonas vaginalis G3]KAI5537155.1 hypothetical protein TVAGG3_0436730 [Trichomonas vaginalis G3]|eukprot:XP_001299858.1 hypothetical protein [Trichomonas vaginalis G3]